MVLLSFSVKKDELLAGTKIRTTRLYTAEKWALWNRTQSGGDLVLEGWWKPRTKEGFRIFERKGQDIYRLVFRELNGRQWPLLECEPGSGYFYHMTWGAAQKWAREEGFENDLNGLVGVLRGPLLPAGLQGLPVHRLPAGGGLMPSIPESKLPQCLEPPERRNACKHYRKTVRRCVRKWAFGRGPSCPCDGWCKQ